MNGHLLPQLWELSCLPLSGAPDTCEMVLSRGLGTHRRRILLSRAHCSQLELRLHTVIFTSKKLKGAGHLGLRRPAFLGYACLNQHDASKSPALAPKAWILFLVWTPMSGEQKWGGATSIPIWKKRGVCSQQPGNWKHWSQPTSSGHPGFSPRR